uniref:Uncharacterized protein n=1 Tax=Brassica oleracea TaxID=3712 RepID=A0A3P6GJU6_BRAOL|nr:unnamed protein product [Brassica oleracea]
MANYKNTLNEFAYLQIQPQLTHPIRAQSDTFLPLTRVKCTIPKDDELLLPTSGLRFNTTMLLMNWKMDVADITYGGTSEHGVVHATEALLAEYGKSIRGVLGMLEHGQPN